MAGIVRIDARRLARALLIVCGLSQGVVKMAYAEQPLSNGYKAPQARMPDTPFQRLRLGETEFSLPTGYVDYYSRKPGPLDDFVLRTVWPDMSPHWPIYQVPRDLKSDEAPIGILVSLASSTTSVEFRTNVAKNHSQIPAEPLYGLNHRITPETPPRNDWLIQTSDVYYSSGRPDMPATLIRCDFKSDFIAYPHCEQDIVYRDFLLQISFPKALVPQWRTVDEKILALFSSFIVAPRERK